MSSFIYKTKHKSPSGRVYYRPNPLQTPGQPGKRGNKMYEHILLIADTTNGIRKADIVDYPEAEMLSFDDFKDSLDAPFDGEIFTQVLPAGTDGKFEELAHEYGIN